MVSGCPSLLQVTVVAGEPVEIQVRVDDMCPWVNPRCVILGGSGEGTTHPFIILQPRVPGWLDIILLVTKRGHIQKQRKYSFGRLQHCYVYK